MFWLIYNNVLYAHHLYTTYNSKYAAKNYYFKLFIESSLKDLRVYFKTKCHIHVYMPVIINSVMTHLVIIVIIHV